MVCCDKGTVEEWAWPTKNLPREVVAMEIFPGVSMDPGIRFGKPCLTGTRIDVATVVGALAAGESFEAVEEAYQLTREQVLSALRYAAHVTAHLPPAVQEVS
jgi:uncharacterized protein (DUF433 family)